MQIMSHHFNIWWLVRISK